MSDIKSLLESITAAETRLLESEFLAPCVPCAKLRTRVHGLIYTFSPSPRRFEGWGIFKPVTETRAALVEEASLPAVLACLKLFESLRVRLAYRLSGQTWMAYPVNESDARQRTGRARPLPVRLVAEGAQFDCLVARWDGAALWFEGLDRSADPQVASRLREQLQTPARPEEVRLKTLTPEMRTTYELAFQRTAPGRQVRERGRDRARLSSALYAAGGALSGFDDHDDYWMVEWTTRDGERHTSAITKSDLTVISSGICLSGRDRDFDLTSLVGVVEGRSPWL